jgi:hypothetical protein
MIPDLSKDSLQAFRSKSELLIEPVVGAEHLSALAKCGSLGATLSAFGPAAGKYGRNFLASVRILSGRPAPHRRSMPLQQFVIQTDKGLGASGIPLAGAPAIQLTVDSAGFVTLGGDDMQPPQFSPMGAEPDVGPSSGHVCCDGNAPAPAGTGDNPGFGILPDGVEYLMVKIFGG